MAVPVQKYLRVLSAAFVIASVSILFASCGSSEEKKPGDSITDTKTDTTHVQQPSGTAPHSDSVAKIPADHKTAPKQMDSATIMETANVLDSLMKVKKK